MHNLIFAGTFSQSGGSRGVYRFRQNSETGELHEEGLALDCPDCSFLTLLPQKKRAYGVSKLMDTEGQSYGAVVAMGLDPSDGSLSMLNSQDSLGNGPCHVSASSDGKHVLVANYNGGNATLFCARTDGTLEPACCNIQHEGRGPHPSRQKQAHIHSVTLSPDERFVIVADLGLDVWRIYRLDGKQLILNGECQTAAGAGPRHFAFHPDGRHAFGINELDSTLSAFQWDAQAGTLKEINTVALLPEDFSEENTAGDIHVSADGAYVYGSNRGHDSIVCCSIDPQTRAVTMIQRTPCGGAHPRNFALAPDGRFLYVANMNSHNIVCFRIDRGLLIPAKIEVSLGMPVCLKFLAIA